jgi:DNA-binding transcriptional regulator YiaG
MDSEQRKSVVQYSAEEIFQAAINSESERFFRTRYRWAFLAALQRGNKFFKETMSKIPQPKSRSTKKRVLGPKPINKIVLRRILKVRHAKRIMIGKYFKEKRIEAGLKLEDVASKFECSSGHVSNWERGASMPPVKLLKKICEFYKIGNKEEIVRLYVGLYERELRSVLF